MNAFAPTPQLAQPLLEIADLRVTLSGIPLVDGVSLAIAPGEIFGLVGESGSGKTLTALAILRLLSPQLCMSGAIRLDGRDLLSLSERDMHRVRGAQIGMVFQEPVAALNPTFSIGSQLIAAIRAHAKLGGNAARSRAIELLEMVGIPSAARRLAFYPHALSGGMCQRVMIAMALAGGAKLLVADEPTTSLDVTIQDEIIRLVERLARETGIAVLFISHDLGLVARLCHRIAVAYAGQVVETGSARDLLHRPRHPYTQALVRCVPDLTEIGVLRRGIPGYPPAAGSWPAGCRFRTRCPEAGAACEQPQALLPIGYAGSEVRCWRRQSTETAVAAHA
jgi:oligopeptide/dipeptide ABC transporter ATP-binding protein